MSEADLVCTALEWTPRDGMLTNADRWSPCLLSTRKWADVPVTASPSVNNTAPVLSMNAEVGQRHFFLSAPQAELDHTRQVCFFFSRGSCHTTGLLGCLLPWKRSALPCRLLSGVFIQRA